MSSPKGSKALSKGPLEASPASNSFTATNEGKNESYPCDENNSIPHSTPKKSGNASTPKAETNSELVMTAAAALTSLTNQGYSNRRDHMINPAHVSAMFGGIPNEPRIFHQSVVPSHNQQGYSQFAPTPTGILVPQQLKGTNVRQKATRFPVKHEHIISWTPDGLSFVVKKPSLLVSKVLPSYFKEVKFSSFTRKLHRWGFIKILRGKELSAYFHKNFRRGNFELCARMNCSKGGGSPDDIDISHLLKQQDILPRGPSVIQQHQESAASHHEHLLREHLARERLALSNLPGLTASALHQSSRPGIVKMHQFLSKPREVAPFPRHQGVALHLNPQQFVNAQEQFYAVNNVSPDFRLNNIRNNAMAFNNGMTGSMLSTPSEIELERERNSLHHKRIMEEAWNALSLESKLKVSRGKGIPPSMHGLPH